MARKKIASAAPLAFVTEIVDVDSLKPHPRNYKAHPKKQLEHIEANLRQYGFYKNVVVAREDTILAGHGVIEAAKRLGWKQAPVRRMDLDPDDPLALKLVAADNELPKLGETDNDALNAILRDVHKSTSLLGTGYDDRTLALLSSVPPALEEEQGPEKGDEDVVPEPPKTPVTKVGDVWELGPHLVLCGDSFVEEDRAKILGKHPVDCILTDPPYAIYGSSTGIGADIADDKMVRPFFEQLFRVFMVSIKEFGHAYVCCDWRSWGAIWDSAKRAQLTAKNCLVWDKGSSGLGSMYANTYEMVGFFARLPPATAMTSTMKRGQRQVHKPNVLRFPRVTGDERQHNAAKPVAMFQELLQNSTDQNDLVCDFFLGSGTTVIAAEKAGRRARGFEIEPRFCDVIVERWERLTGGKATRRT